MWMRAKVGVLSAVFLAACASAGGGGGEVVPDVDPTGSYTLATTIDGSPVDGQMQIQGEAGAYTGTVYTDYTGELTITSVNVRGAKAFMTADTPDGQVYLEITFDGERFTGTWWMGSDQSAVEGRRVSR